MLSFASDKAALFAKKSSKNSNLDGFGISLPVFPSRTNLKLHNIFITLKMGKKVIVMILKNCEPKLSYILAEFFNMCLKESRLLQGLSVFKNVEKGLLLKTTALLVFFLWLVKSLKNLNNRIVDHLDKCGLFLISSMVLGFLDQLQIF